jgi:putative F0F1-ATPase subunit (Ca2+/Mg2+ transporter)
LGELSIPHISNLRHFVAGKPLLKGLSCKELKPRHPALTLPGGRDLLPAHRGDLEAALALKDQYTVLKYGHLGLTFAIVLCGSLFLGVKADQKFGTGSTLTLLCGGLGMAAAFYHLLTAVSRLGQEEAESSAEGKNGKTATGPSDPPGQNPDDSREPPRP